MSRKTATTYPIPSAEAILQAVCDRWGFTTAEIRTGRRTGLRVHARWAACWMMREVRNDTLQSIADALKLDSHTSVLHAIRGAADLLAGNAEFRSHLQAVRDLLQPHRGGEPI